jgi:hypothetical protein
MAFISENESIYPLIEELVKEENCQNINLTKEKYLYAVLNWIYKNQNLFLDPLGAVECVYADFDYPENMLGFVQYASSNEPNLGSLELNLKRIYDKWLNYLRNEEMRWRNDI